MRGYPILVNCWQKIKSLRKMKVLHHHFPNTAINFWCSPHFHTSASVSMKSWSRSLSRSRLSFHGEIAGWPFWDAACSVERRRDGAGRRVPKKFRAILLEKIGHVVTSSASKKNVTVDWAIFFQSTIDDNHKPIFKKKRYNIKHWYNNLLMIIQNIDIVFINQSWSTQLINSVDSYKTLVMAVIAKIDPWYFSIPAWL